MPKEPIFFTNNPQPVRNKDGLLMRAVLTRYRTSTTREVRDALHTLVNNEMRIAVDARDIHLATVWLKVADRMQEMSLYYPITKENTTVTSMDSATFNLPYKLLRTTIIDKMPDVTIEEWSSGEQGSLGLRINFPETDKFVLVSGSERRDLFRGYHPDRGLSFGYLGVDDIVVFAFADADMQDSEPILVKMVPSTFTHALDIISQRISQWRKEEALRVEREVEQWRLDREKAEQAAEASKKNKDDKYFPFKPMGFGGCKHTGLINDASNEAAIEIMNDLLELDHEKGPGTPLLEAFGGNEEVGDQLQSILMAAYQRGLVDLLKGDLNLRDIVAAGLDGGVIKSDDN